jgi:hypothetical protein
MSEEEYCRPTRLGLTEAFLTSRNYERVRKNVMFMAGLENEYPRYKYLKTQDFEILSWQRRLAAKKPMSWL